MIAAQFAKGASAQLDGLFRLGQELQGQLFDGLDSQQSRRLLQSDAVWRRRWREALTAALVNGTGNYVLGRIERLLLKCKDMGRNHPYNALIWQGCTPPGEQTPEDTGYNSSIHLHEKTHLHPRRQRSTDVGSTRPSIFY